MATQDTPIHLQWAEDVMEVYKHIQRGFGDKENVTEAQHAMLDWATNPENKKIFFKEFVPKAADMLSKGEGDDPALDGLLQGERKAIAELQLALADAVEASKSAI